MVDPTDVESIAAGIDAGFSDSIVREKLRKAGLISSPERKQPGRLCEYTRKRPVIPNNSDGTQFDILLFGSAFTDKASGK